MDAFAVKVFDMVTGLPLICLFDHDMGLVSKVEFADLEDPEASTVDELYMNVSGVGGEVFIGTASFDYDGWNRHANYIFGFDAQGQILWKHRGFIAGSWPDFTQRWHSSRQVTCADGVAYASHVDPPGISAYDIVTGALLFESGVSQTGAFEQNNLIGQAVIPMSLGDGLLTCGTFGFANPRVRALDAVDGSIIFNELFGVDTNLRYIHAHDGLLIVAATHTDVAARVLQGRRRSDNGVEWSRPSDELHFAAVASHDEGALYSVWSPHDLHASLSFRRLSKIDMLTGDRDWTYNPVGDAPPGLAFPGLTILGTPEYHLGEDHLFVLHRAAVPAIQRIRRADGGVDWSASLPEQFVSGTVSQRHCLAGDRIVVARDSDGGAFDAVSFDGDVETGLGGLSLADLGVALESTDSLQPEGFVHHPSTFLNSSQVVITADPLPPIVQMHPSLSARSRSKSVDFE